HVKGCDWDAQAEKVEVRDCCVVLSGHVKLHCDAIGENATVSADKVCLKVKDGHFVELMKGCGEGCCAGSVYSCPPLIQKVTPIHYKNVSGGLQRIGVDFGR